MTAIVWDEVGSRTFETGVDHGVLYPQNSSGAYTKGVAWNGLTSINETPSGAEASPQYADNIKYLNLYSAEELGVTVEAYTYPDEFAKCDGTAEPTKGVFVGQQARQGFGLAYRTKVGTDVNSEAGYKIHLLYGCKASPSQRGYSTVNDSPEAINFSWELSTTPVPLTNHPELKPTALLIIDSTKVDGDKLKALEKKLYGDESSEPMLPSPDDVIAMIEGDED